MPLGGGDIGMNVWVDDSTFTTHCYVSQSGWFDENNTLLKAGLLHISPLDSLSRRNPASVNSFEHRLCLRDGYQRIRIDDMEITLWVDVWKPVIHIEANVPVEVRYESWRTKNIPLTRAVGQQSSWKWIVPEGTVTHPDQTRLLKNSKYGSLLFWHQNTDTTVFDYTVHQQQLDAYSDQLWNPLKGRIFGGCLKQLSQQHFVLTLCNAQFPDGDRTKQWVSWYRQVRKTGKSIRSDHDRKATRKWWNKFWQRSYIEAGPSCSDTVRLMVRNYNLFRYLLGCNAHPSDKGERWPSKFNGGLFTFHPLDADTTQQKIEREHPGLVTPDYRKWGGGTHTAQNQRLLYWPLLRTGDSDALRGQFDYYLRLLPAAELRSRHYWNIEGACFCEQLENFGLPNPAEYGKHKDGGDPGIEDNKWLEYEWDTALEFAQMMLMAKYPEAEKFALSCVRFFNHFYSRNGEPFTLYPGSGCETYKRAKNPASTLAALHQVTSTLLNSGRLTKAERTELADFLQRLPALPLCKQASRTASDSVVCYAPAESWERIQNVETPQLYPVWPWRMADPEIGRNSYLNDTTALKHRSYIGWKQDNIWAACLGLTDEAFRLTAQKLLAHPYRFPAFWGPGFDWMPDLNWGGSAMIGLQEMLFQETPDGQYLFLPAWPKDQEIHFKFYDRQGKAVVY
ncbi:MAG: hypothetical protein IJP70_10905 [Bacteroidales bacterium]|nr:hypothetical protein [Bacteroidales bacterium]